MLRPLALLVGASLTALSHAVPEGPLESLSVDDVQELLKDWNLHNAFGEAFVADEVDGKTMLYLHVDDLQKEQHYPNARNFHARRLIAERDALAKGSKENVDVSSGGVVRRGLKESSGASSGVAIRSNSSCLSMGTTLDVSLCRDGDSSLLCNSSFGVSDTLDVAGDASFASELYFVGSNGGSVALSDLHGDVAALGDSLSDLAAASATNAADIIVNAADIAGNAALASTNAANITANNADIAVNMAEIAALRAKTDIAPTKLDQAKKEAFCSRINCCNENSEFVDDDTLHCWSDQYASFEEDPCSCTVKFVEEVDKSWSWHERFGHSLCAVNPAGSVSRQTGYSSLMLTFVPVGADIASMYWEVNCFLCTARRQPLLLRVTVQLHHRYSSACMTIMRKMIGDIRTVRQRTGWAGTLGSQMIQTAKTAQKYTRVSAP